MTVLTKTGQPRMGAILTLATEDLQPIPCRVVGKLYGHGGNADLIGIIVEDANHPGHRETFEWPLCHGANDKPTTLDDDGWDIRLERT